MDYFTLFGLPVRYQVDGSLLVSQYQMLQHQFHPDRYVNASSREQRQAIQQAATINEAYQTLKHPLRRAEYLLFLQGIDVNNERHTLHDRDFLHEQWMLREQLDEIAHQPKASEALAVFMTHFVAMIQERTAQMSTELDNQQWELAVDTVRKLRFLDKLQQQTEQLEERLLDQ